MKVGNFSKIVLTEVCELHIIELPKLKELIESGELSDSEKRLAKWTKFLLTPEELGVIDMENDEAIKKAKEEYEIAKEMIKNGEDIQKIIKYTGLTKEEIENITKTED